MPRELKLTAINLRMDKLLLLRSVLRAVNKKTVDRWSFSEDSDSHVAISGATAPLPGPVSTRLDAATSRKQIRLIDSDEAPGTSRETLAYPIRPSEFIDLLNSISDSLSSGEVVNRKRSSPTPSVAPDLDDPGEFRFAFALRELLRLGSRHPYRIKANGVELHIVPASRSMLRSQPLDETSILRLIQARSDVMMSPMTEKETTALAAAGARPMPVDTLLWRIGIESRVGRMLPDLPRDGYFALKRWPDFGGMAPNRNHLRMASVLTLAAKNVGELAKASESTVQQARGFINACALLDLVEIRAEASKAPPLARQQPGSQTLARRRFGGVFQSIRSALGLGSD